MLILFGEFLMLCSFYSILKQDSICIRIFFELVFSIKPQSLSYVSQSETVWFRHANRTVHSRKLYVSRKGNVKNALKKKRWLQGILLFFAGGGEVQPDKGHEKRDTVKVSLLIFKYCMITVHIPSSVSDSSGTSLSARVRAVRRPP